MESVSMAFLVVLPSFRQLVSPGTVGDDLVISLTILPLALLLLVWNVCVRVEIGKPLSNSETSKSVTASYELASLNLDAANDELQMNPLHESASKQSQ